MAVTNKISPTFAGNDYEVIMRLVAKARTETGIPNLSVGAAILRVARKELEINADERKAS